MPRSLALEGHQQLFRRGLLPLLGLLTLGGCNAPERKDHPRTPAHQQDNPLLSGSEPFSPEACRAHIKKIAQSHGRRYLLPHRGVVLDLGETAEMTITRDSCCILFKTSQGRLFMANIRSDTKTPRIPASEQSDITVMVTSMSQARLLLLLKEIGIGKGQYSVFRLSTHHDNAEMAYSLTGQPAFSDPERQVSQPGNIRDPKVKIAPTCIPITTRVEASLADIPSEHFQMEQGGAEQSP